jgi:hypothetical protein
MISGLETHDVQIWRPTWTEQSSGDDVRTYGTSPLIDNLPVVLDKLTSGRKREQFGLKKEALYAMVCDFGVDVTDDDVVVIKAGAFGVEEAFLVMEVVEDMRHQSRIVGLNETDDGPPIPTAALASASGVVAAGTVV